MNVMFQMMLYHNIYILWINADIIHNDLSPNNLMCMSENITKIIDYGEAFNDVSIQAHDDQHMLFMMSILNFIKNSIRENFVFEETGIFWHIYMARQTTIELIHEAYEIPLNLFDPNHGDFNYAANGYLDILIARVITHYILKQTLINVDENNKDAFYYNNAIHLMNAHKIDRIFSVYANQNANYYDHLDAYTDGIVTKIKKAAGIESVAVSMPPPLPPRPKVGGAERPPLPPARLQRQRR